MLSLLFRLLLSLLLITSAVGCATIRVTDPTRTATEQFLMSEATRKAVEQLSAETLRDRKIFIDTSYLITAAYPTPENLFLVAELRNKLLLGGVRLVPRREDSQIVLEVRSGGIGIDRLEYLLGIPSVYLNNLGNNSVANTSSTGGLSTPELA